ncbi:hypothetical protein FB545_2130 [Peribacillus frigoritolerans]|nr:hypothetical protein FB545_2130 [Peribacillus frigoritolerans]
MVFQSAERERVSEPFKYKTSGMEMDSMPEVWRQNGVRTE